MDCACLLYNLDVYKRQGLCFCQNAVRYGDGQCILIAVLNLQHAEHHDSVVLFCYGTGAKGGSGLSSGQLFIVQVADRGAGPLWDVSQWASRLIVGACLLYTSSYHRCLCGIIILIMQARLFMLQYNAASFCLEIKKHGCLKADFSFCAHAEVLME